MYSSSCDPTVINLDRGSVTTNDPYFYFCPGQTSIFINIGIINQVNYDLWVSPDGDNDNDGVSPQTPLKNISYALAKIQPSGNATLTVHVTPGVYSWSQTGEALPLQPKSYVNIIGEEMQGVILDGEQYSTFVIGIWAQDYLTIKNFTLINGHAARNNLFWFDDTLNGVTDIISVENIHIRDSWVKFDAFRIMSCHNLTVNNLIIEDSQVGNGFTYTFTRMVISQISGCNALAQPTMICTILRVRGAE